MPSDFPLSYNDVIFNAPPYSAVTRPSCSPAQLPPPTERTNLPPVSHTHLSLLVPPYIFSLPSLAFCSLGFQLSGSCVPLASNSPLFFFINPFFLIHAACCDLQFQNQVICVIHTHTVCIERGYVCIRKGVLLQWL